MWGYRGIDGELLVFGVTVAASTVWEILKHAGIDRGTPAHQHHLATFLRSQAQPIVGADFVETTALTGVRLYVLAAVEDDLQDITQGQPRPFYRPEDDLSQSRVPA